jgi:hypothetical protein
VFQGRYKAHLVEADSYASRVRVGDERVSRVAEKCGYRDANGVTRVVQRLEAEATRDRILAAKLKSLAATVNS